VNCQFEQCQGLFDSATRSGDRALSTELRTFEAVSFDSLTSSAGALRY
jgi:hypothetical protein